ncbi:MAG TPA: peptide MFS transporter [Candidatus Binatia bacterium]|nr:peptide MFS transporter [Candidatus Binatia bacterium]
MGGKHDLTTTREPVLTRAKEVTFMGHPKGLFYLALTEAWERFSYYGMTALLALFMVNQLLLPGHVEHIGGFSGFRAALESVVGPLSTQALASQIFGLYSGFVYFTPLLGGMIADRWIGQRNAVVIGALSMSGGHIAIAFDQSFLLALLLLVIGSGFLKGNISAQVGALYPPEDEVRRTRGFVIFSTGINIGAIIGPLFCGLLAQVYGWHYGFGIAAIFMLLGLATYLYGYRYLPARVERRKFEGTRLTVAERRIVGALIAVMIITIFQSTAFYQVFNVNPIWIQQHVGLDIGGFRIPVPWFQSINSVSSVLCVPLVFWIWRHQAMRRREPNDLAKIGMGAWITAASNLILVFAIFVSRDAPVHPIWPFLYSSGLGISFLYYWPTLLALVSRAAPAKVNATLMGLAFMSLFVSNNLIGWIGGFYEKMMPAQFWAMHAAIAIGGGLLVVLFGRRLSRTLYSPLQKSRTSLPS